MQYSWKVKNKNMTKRECVELFYLVRVMRRLESSPTII